jgi:hypothetical protein
MSDALHGTDPDIRPQAPDSLGPNGQPVRRSWPETAAEHHSQTEHHGAVTVRAWSGLHPKNSLASRAIQQRERRRREGHCDVGCADGVVGGRRRPAVWRPGSASPSRG